MRRKRSKCELTSQMDGNVRIKMKANKPTGGKFSRFILAQMYLAETAKEKDEQVQTVASGSTPGLQVGADVQGGVRGKRKKIVKTRSAGTS